MLTAEAGTGCRVTSFARLAGLRRVTERLRPRGGGETAKSKEQGAGSKEISGKSGAPTTGLLTTDYGTAAEPQGSQRRAKG
jgi:hypothetical protein